MTTRTIVLDIDTNVGKKLYWFLKAVMEKFPDAIKEREEDVCSCGTELKHVNSTVDFDNWAVFKFGYCSKHGWVRASTPKEAEEE